MYSQISTFLFPNPFHCKHDQRLSVCHHSYLTARLSYPLSRRTTLSLTTAALLTLILPNQANSAITTTTADAVVTDRVYLDIRAAGRPLGRLVLGLFGQEAPNAVNTFKQLCLGEFAGRRGRRVGYRGSTAWRIVKGERIDLGRISQIDELGQLPGVPQRVDVGVTAPRNFETNGLKHDTMGVVSVKKGGGGFEWMICSAREGCAGGSFDKENLVIGKVIEGMDVVERLDAVPTNKKNAGAFRIVGKAIGDARAKIKLENKPLQKVVVYDSGVL